LNILPAVKDCFVVPPRNDGTINEQLFGISSLSFIPVQQNTVIASEAKQPVAFPKLINSAPSLRGVTACPDFTSGTKQSAIRPQIFNEHPNVYNFRLIST